MADNVSVVEQVVTAPATTVVQDATNVANPPATPEPNLLTKVSQFKLPDNQDKINNPPDQPEFAAITDPVAKKAAQEAVERMRRGMQSDYTKKIQEAQNLVNQSKSWTPQRIQQELLTNPEFLQAAQMIQGQQPSQERALTQEEYSALTDNEKAQLAAVPQLKNELIQIKQEARQEQLMASINIKDAALVTKYPDYNPKEITQFAIDVQKIAPADARELLYKAKMHDINVTKAYEMGKLEGQGKLNSKLNVITPQGSTIVNTVDVPKKNTGESNQAFFLRLGQFRLAQSKNQK